VYESRHHPLLTRAQFGRRLLWHGLSVVALVVLSLGIGMIGYAHYENLAWRDGFLDSAMLLGGMGPVHAPRTDGGKLFAGFYALYAGLVFIVGASVIVAPVLHRLLHRFHWEAR